MSLQGKSESDYSFSLLPMMNIVLIINTQCQENPSVEIRIDVF